MQGAIIEGKYGQYCVGCIQSMKRHDAPGSAQYHRDKDREDHLADMIQPWDAKGNPSKEFIQHYPDEAKEMFTQGELEAHG